MKRYLLALVAALFAVSAMAAAADVVTVTATGRATIVGGNRESAHQAALENARRDAVAQVGTEVVAETVAENFELVRDVVITRVAGYIENQKITADDCPGAECVVTIEAQVSAKEIKDDATLIYSQMAKPRVMVFIPETGPSGEVVMKSSLVENAIMDYFKSKGFELVDRSQALANIEADRLKAAASGDAKEATMLGARAGAEVIVIGAANLGVPESIRGILYASTPTISVRALNTANASVYATASEVGKGQGGTPDQAQKTALQETANRVGKDIFWKIVQAWNNEKLNGQPVELVVSGLPSLSALTKLKKELAGLEGVKEVVQRDFAAPTATLTVYVQGDANRLAELIEAKKLGTVTGVTPGKVTMKVK